MKTLITACLFVASILLISYCAIGQELYAEIEYMKVKPDKWDAYLNGEKIYKKIHKSRMAAKGINNWHLYQRLYPSGALSEYDYATLTYYSSGEQIMQKESNATWDAAAKGLTEKEKASAWEISKTRALVFRDLYTHYLGVGTSIKPGEIIRINKIKVSGANKDNYNAMLTMLKPVVEAAIKAGKLKGWNIWYRTLQTNTFDESNCAVVFTYPNLAAALKTTTGNIETEFKSIYPEKDYKTFMEQLSGLRQILGQEIWMLVDAVL